MAENGPLGGSHVKYIISLYRENNKKIFLFESLDVWYVASPNWYFTKFVHIMILWQKRPKHPQVACLTLTYSEKKKIFLSETSRPRVLIFGI